MIKIPPKFNFRDISKWRSVDLSTTMKIAHMSSSGVDFRGSSKSSIIESMAKPHGYSTNADKFVKLMDVAAKVIPRVKSDYDNALWKELYKAADEFTGKTKPEDKDDAAE